jgi:hypothetical protein
MTRQAFECAMDKARTLQRLGDRPGYWEGYIRGLCRAYYGEHFETPEEHKKWLSLLGDEDASQKERGEGYREGLKEAG